ncbi:GntR family transcriptional regulator [Epibacterium sp. Ofav1-8]|uniref:GntR family transcriptional regulator n=1 Tax=Epibacterium sp. Ofav1-8 TaxID=2917735 RepID=UPI001EF48B79|nr:GntR family transcriptional regulator [Epibacterium sp. Ofav1-8]MCG7623595.1 GntR family transcriptional regulator [Epibacterium sp. Ofav1-8]
MSETAVDKIFRALMERIVTGDLPAGEKLRQDHIARDYEVSHVPVREAFLRLEAKGLAKSIPHKGMRVTALEPTEIREVIEMRVALEVLALTHAMPRHDAESVSTAEAARRDCDAATDMVTWDRCNRRFHLALLAPCAMPRLLASIEDLHITAARHMFANWRTRWAPRPDGDHAALMTAVQEQDLAQACDLLRRHLRRVS